MMPDSEPFILDQDEWTDAEIEAEPRCNWTYRGFTCFGRIKWRINTTFSNASKTEFFYCAQHGARFHESVYNWSQIDHNTKADTRIWNLDTQSLCACSEGEECETLTSYRAAHPTIIATIAHNPDAKPAWEY